MHTLFRKHIFYVFWFLALALWPLVEYFLPEFFRATRELRIVFIFTLLALGLHVVTGLSGQLNLGTAAFMAVGAYTYSILTVPVYPFQLGFIPAAFITILIGALFGWLISIPTARLRGDYLAIVTLAFGEITQEVLRNLESITKGTLGLNPVYEPQLLFTQQGLNQASPYAWYYFLLIILIAATFIVHNLEHSEYGLGWACLRQDELATRSIGLSVTRLKAFALLAGSSLAALAGALYAALLQTSGEPGNYDFQISVLALCCVIVGGLSSLRGVLVGSLIMLGLNSIILSKFSLLLTNIGVASTNNVFLAPTNWKYFLFGLVLVLMMRFKPDGLLPSKFDPARLTKDGHE